MLGQNILPRSVDPIVNTVDHGQIANSLNSMKSAMNSAAAKMPTHETFLRKYAWAAEPAMS